MIRYSLINTRRYSRNYRGFDCFYIQQEITNDIPWNGGFLQTVSDRKFLTQKGNWSKNWCRVRNNHKFNSRRWAIQVFKKKVPNTKLIENL